MFTTALVLFSNTLMMASSLHSREGPGETTLAHLCTAISATSEVFIITGAHWSMR